MSAEETIESSKRILVTGASGFLGRRLVSALSELGFEVRALTRKESRKAQLRELGAEPFLGDVSDLESLTSAFSDVDFVVHAAADTAGSIEAGRLTTIQGTRNVLELCTRSQIEKLVYISSCSVYGIANNAVQTRVDEGSPLEAHPEKRGPYSSAKFEAEQLVLDYMQVGPTATVCLRPGMIYGPAGELYSPMLGFSFRNRLFAVIGNGRFVLPLVYVDNLVDAIIASLKDNASDGQVYNVVDPERIDKQRYMQKLIKRLHPTAKYFYFPQNLLHLIVLCQEKLFELLHKKPYLTRYRLISSQKPIIYDSSKLQRQLGWQQRVSFEEAISRIESFERI